MFLITVPTYSLAVVDSRGNLLTPSGSPPNTAFGPGIRGVITLNDLERIIINIANVLFFLLVISTTFFVLYAAYLYLTSGGEAETTKKARNYIIYAAIALAIGFFARALPGVVAGVVGGGSNGSSSSAPSTGFGGYAIPPDGSGY